MKRKTLFLKFKNKTNLTDQDLLANYQQSRDPEMLGALYSRYMVLVYGLCLKYYDDREQARDMVMQIFEKLTEDILHQDIQNFKSWLYVYSKNMCLMDLRKSKSLKIKEEKWLETETEFMENPDYVHPIDENLHGNLDIALKDCIAKLKSDQEQCIKLFYFKNKSYREIAEETGLAENKVKSLLQNGKRNLKICLDKKNVRRY